MAVEIKILAKQDSGILESAADKSNSDYDANVRHHEKLLADLYSQLEHVRKGGSQKSVNMFLNRLARSPVPASGTSSEKMTTLPDPGARAPASR